MWGNSLRAIFIVSFLSVLLLSAFAISSEEWKIDILDNVQVTLEITGPPNTPFSLDIIDHKEAEVFSRESSTDHSGSYFLSIPLEDGNYTTIIRSGQTTESKEFVAGSSDNGENNISSESGSEDTQPVYVPAAPIAKLGKVEYLDGLDTLGEAITETITRDRYNLSAYDTRIELLDYRSSPVSQMVTYRLFNKREKDYSYVAVATSGEIRNFRAWHLENRTEKIIFDNITHYDGNVTDLFVDAPLLEYVPLSLDDESGKIISNYTKVGYPYQENYTKKEKVSDKPELITETKDFLEKWENGWFDSVKSYIGSAGAPTDLSVLDKSVLPEPGQMVYIYRVPHSQGTWEYFEYETSNDPSKFLALDPGGGSWWNDSWVMCRNITISNAGSTVLSDFPAYINVSYVTGKMQTDYGDIRFVNTSCNNNGTVLDYEIENYTSSNAHVWVGIPSLPTAGTTISMYYNNSQAENGENPEDVWKNNYVGVWHLSESGTGTRYDSTRYGNNGSTSGYEGDEAVNGVVGGADKLDGNNDFIQLSDTDEIDCDSSDELTVEAFIRFNAQNDRTYFFSNYDGDGYFLASDYNSPYSRGRFTSYPGDHLYTTGSLQLDNWYYLVGTYKTGTDNQKIYVNGIFNNSLTGTGDLMTVTANPTIGSYSNYYTNGTIDSLKVSNVSRSADWINQSYQMVINQKLFVIWGPEENDQSPHISIESPRNTSYKNTIDLNITTDKTANWCGWNLNSSGSNFSMSGSGTTWWSSISTTEGIHQLYVYCNDSSGNMGSNNSIYFTYDTTRPLYSGNNTSPTYSTEYLPSQDYQFNITWQDNENVGTVKLEHNMTGSLCNDTVTTSQGNEWYFDVESLAAGTYVYRWYANDTAGNENSTGQMTYLVEKNNTDVKLYLNGTQDNMTMTYGDYANLTAVLDAPQNFYLYRNTVEINSGQAPVVNVTNNFANGTYNITAYYGGNENYTGDSETFFIFVKKATPSLSITMEPDTTMTYETETNVTCSITNGDGGTTLTLYRNGSQYDQRPDQVQEIETLAASVYNYTCFYPGSENYTSLSVINNFLDVEKKATEIYLLINGTRHDTGFTQNDHANFTVELNGYPGKDVELWTNYSDGSWKLWASGKSPMINVTQMTVTGKFDFIGNYSGDENYTYSEESWNVIVSLLELEANIESMDPSTIDQYQNSTVIGNCSCTGGDCNNVYIEIMADGIPISNTTGVALQVNGTNPVGLGSLSESWETTTWNVKGWESGDYSIKIKCNSSETGNDFSPTQNLDVRDIIKPKWSANSTEPPSGSTYSYSQDYQFNITWQDNENVGTVKLEHNMTGSLCNDTVTTSQGNEWYFDVESLAAGTYVYRWYANDTAGNENSTGQFTYTINKAAPIVSLSGSNVTYPVSVNIQPSETNSGDLDVNYTLWRNYTLVSYSLGTAPVADTKQLGAGWYEYTLKTTGGENWSSVPTGDSLDLNVSRGKTEIILILNGTESDRNYIQNETANFTVELNVSGKTVYLETNISGWSLQSGATPMMNYTLMDEKGYFNITGYFPGDENYTASSETHFANVTKDIIPPVINWEFPTPNPGETKNQDWIFLNATIKDNSNTSSFFDWNHSLVGYWSFDHVSSLGVFDNSSYNNFGTFGGNLEQSNITSGKYGNGLKFNGIDDFIDVGDSDELDGMSGLTLEAWINTNDVTTGARRILIKSTPNWSEPYYLYSLFTYSGGLGFGISDGSTRVWEGRGTLSINQWQHIAGTYNGTHMRWFINGQEIGSPKNIGFSSISTNDENVLIGKAKGSNTEFEGSIDEVKIYKRALTKEEIEYSYKNGLGIFYRNFTGLEEGNYDYTAWAIDLAGNMNTSSRNVTIDLVPKYWDNSTNSTESGEITEFRLRWTDMNGLSGYIFSFDNGTGTFSNGTGWQAFPVGGNEDWSNETRLINSTEGSMIRWKVYANDTNDNWNVSDTFSFETLTGFNITINTTFGPSANTNISIYNSSGQLITEGEGNLSINVDAYELYDIVFETETTTGNQKTILKNVNITQNTNVNTQVVETYSGNLPVGIANVTSIYAQEDLSVEYEYATVYMPNSGLDLSYILHCTNWDFEVETCYSWEANRTSDYNAQQNSTHIWFNVTEFDGYGSGELVWLDVNLTVPQDTTIVPRERNFTINATVFCRNGTCGDVYGTARYNSSGTEPDTNMSNTSGSTPFYTFENNPRWCGNLDENENCTILWKVNSTGNIGDFYEIGVFFYTENVSNHTQNSTVEIGKVLLMSLEFDSINFGVLDPGENEKPALNNSDVYYNISIDENSNDLDYLWVKATDIVGEAWTNYEIGPGNLSWSFENNPATKISIGYSYSLMDQNVPSGQNKTTYYWLDVPYGLMNQNYLGTLTIMANASW